MFIYFFTKKVTADVTRNVIMISKVFRFIFKCLIVDKNVVIHDLFVFSWMEVNEMREDTIMPGTVETMVVTTTVITVTEIWAQDLEQEFQV